MLQSGMLIKELFNEFISTENKIINAKNLQRCCCKKQALEPSYFFLKNILIGTPVNVKLARIWFSK